MARAYGWSDLALEHDFRETPLGLRYTIDDRTRVEILDRLLKLNLERSSEKTGRRRVEPGDAPMNDPRPTIPGHGSCSRPPTLATATSKGERYEYPSHIANAQRIAAGDLLVVARTGKEASDGRRIVGVGHVGRVEEIDGGRIAIFDRYLRLTEPASFDDVGGDPRSNKTNSINEVERSLVEALLPREGIASIDVLPYVQTPRDLREELFAAVTKDLIGPAEGPEEEFAGASVRSRYLLVNSRPRARCSSPKSTTTAHPPATTPRREGPSRRRRRDDR